MTRFLLKPENYGYNDSFLSCKDIVDSHYNCITQVIYFLHNIRINMVKH